MNLVFHISEDGSEIRTKALVFLMMVSVNYFGSRRNEELSVYVAKYY